MALSLLHQGRFTMTIPRIYVACLASYNNGILHGYWIDCTTDPEDIKNDIQQMLAASPIENAEEWRIDDYDNFYGFDPTGYLPENLYQLATFIEEYETLGAKLLDIHGDLDAAKQALEDNYLGCFERLSDYAEELTTSTCEIPTCLQYYIDYRSMARDMELNGEFYSIRTGYDEHHLFMN